MTKNDDSIFDFNNSPIKEAYLLLNVKNPRDLDTAYRNEDQKLMLANTWDYENTNLVINKIKKILENISFEKELTGEEKYWRENILWSWYHHAISCAIWRYKDKKAAQRYSTEALKHKAKDHPNKITELLYFLVHDQLEEAENWAKTITTEPEKTTAAHFLHLYKTNKLF